MQQSNCQLNRTDWTVYKNGHIFALPMAENISFSRDYLKHNIMYKI
jgi:hypothetical protein